MVPHRAILVLLGATFFLITNTLPVKLHHSVRNGDEPRQLLGTIYDFFFKDGTRGVQALDSDKEDYDLLKLLFAFAGEETVLKSDGNGQGITLFAPTDEALTQSARDIREVYKLNDTEIPTVENSAWSVYQAWFDKLDDPKAFLSRILNYHIVVDGPLTQAELTNADVNLNTSTGEKILRSGPKLISADKRFEDPELLVDCHYAMDNGIIHSIDRMLFPDPNGQKTEATEHVAPVSEASPSATAPIPTEQSVQPGGPSVQGGVPSPSPSPGSNSAQSSGGESGAACFPASAVVHLSDGSEILVSQLSAGHVIMSSITDRSSSPVYLFSHREHEGLHEFVAITSAHGHQITLTPEHYIYANGRRTAAKRVKLGDRLQTMNGESIVTSIAKVREKGLFAPHTLHGDLVVNGILASSYTTTVSPRLAHMLLWPLRMLVRTGIAVEPLGSLLYNGSPRLAAIIPSGYDVY